MQKLLNFIFKHFEIDLKCPTKNQRLFNASRELITILFAVVLGMGFSKLGDIQPWSGEFWTLILAYFAVILSWWGYHWGTIVGVPETNVFSYLIDFFILVDYWYLINKTDDMQKTLVAYTAMFFLYMLWEIIRYSRIGRPNHKEKPIKNALSVNALFFFIMLGGTVGYYFRGNLQLMHVVLGVLTFLLIIYRIIIHNVYSYGFIPEKETIIIDESKIIGAARKASENARVKLSGFKVGAAILAESGKIYTGCNIEFDNYSNTIHAEESAISAFVSSEKGAPLKIAVYTNAPQVAYPCGMCRQSLYELGGSKLKIIACNQFCAEEKGIIDLLPEPFALES
ncbi:MAG: cytidine deaminase [Candidatus Omnitrophica bacterium]|nr:cytidine deaminase [Candidatus Omnitrophota bacterium]